MQVLNLMVPRTDRDDPNKTYWDPIGKLFIKEDKVWGQLYLTGSTFQAFPPKTKEGSGGPFG